MRKKSKKKQIVAMTLALSVLSSSVGMCGASAAEALPDTDDSGLRVTLRPKNSLSLPPVTTPTSPPTARAMVTIPLLTTNPPLSARSSPRP